ncbi:MAG: DUF721 domain-containing protein [Paracoccaceae bacterium]
MSSEPPDPSRPPEARRRGRPFRRAGTELSRHVVETAARRGFAEPDVLLRWPEIVGPALAAACEPVRVQYGGSAALGATLLVRAEGARAPEVDLLAPTILERVNSYYGYRAVARMRIAQGPVNASGPASERSARLGLAEDPARFDPSGADGADAPSAVERRAAARAEAARLAEGILDNDLKDALTALGAAVLATAPPPKDR